MVEHWNSFVVVGVLDEYWNSLIVVGVLDDLSNRQHVELGVAFPVLSNVYLDLGCLKVDQSISILNIVGCGKDMGGGDEGSSTQIYMCSVQFHIQSHLSKDTDFS